MSEWEGDERRDIDPIRYGVLWQKVQEMDKKVDRLETDIRTLLELANRGKGGLWFGMTVVSAVTGFVGFFVGNR